jgi:hypothetical protein
VHSTPEGLASTVQDVNHALADMVKAAEFKMQ